MSCKSALYSINNSVVSLPDGGTYAPATVVRRYGQNYQLQGNGITLTGPGYYDIAAGATLSGSAAGTITLTAYQDGVAIPGMTASQTIKAAGENPVPYLIALAYPDRDIIDGLDDEGIAKGYETISRNLSARDKKSLYYIFGGDHGSDPHCVIQLILTHLHTPLWDRVGSAQHIMADYQLNKAIGRIPETGFNPDLAMINEAIKQAIKSTMEGKNDYTLEAPQEPKK